MDEASIKRLVRAFGFKPATIGQPQSGYRNTAYPIKLAKGTTANLIIYKNEPGIENIIRRANQVGNYLHAAGLPARRTLDNRILKLTGRQQERYCSLYEYLPGQTISWEAYTMDHLKLLGEAMAVMHGQLKNYPKTEGLPDIADTLLSTVGRMRAYFSDSGVADAMASKLGLSLDVNLFNQHEAVLMAAKRLGDQQALHMDFVRGNILFSQTDPPAISGIIDFEKASRGHRLFDAARTLAFLLVDCKYKEPAKVRQYFWQSGYNKHGRGGLAPVKLGPGNEQLDLLEELLNLFWLHDFYKFLRHNPYESLHQNEHYTRTADLLVARRIVAKST